MPRRPSTIHDLYQLVDLMVDGKQFGFTSAWIKHDTAWTDPALTPGSVGRWYGEIVSNNYRIDSLRLHALEGRTNDHILKGFFRISRVHPRGFDIQGSGALLISKSVDSSNPVFRSRAPLRRPLE
jgi:hypothetical protein